MTAGKILSIISLAVSVVALALALYVYNLREKDK